MPARRVLTFIFFFIVLTFSPLEEVQAETVENYKRTIENYVIPDVTLVNQNGAKVKAGALLNSKKVVMVDFIFTTCTTICPILSVVFSNVQKQLGPELDRVQLISISIDPENDTPKAMKAYLRRYDAKPGWDFLTGTRDDIDKLLKAFSAYTPNKMSHIQLILLKPPSESQWIRIYGLIGTKDLIREYQKVLR